MAIHQSLKYWASTIWMAAEVHILSGGEESVEEEEKKRMKRKEDNKAKLDYTCLASTNEPTVTLSNCNYGIKSSYHNTVTTFTKKL
uniref:Uncharacterized protein n=1 Tax=Onchocerca volvulus TaxID=6282 RepID=A0A8R1TXW7_ONCVO